MSNDENDTEKKATKVEFIKQSEREILIRTHREGGDVVERTATVVPPSEKPRSALSRTAGSSR